MNPINPIQNWLDSDIKLRKIIEKIDLSGKPFEEQAKIVFEQITAQYGLAKFPDEFSQKDYDEHEKLGMNNPRSVYEEIGIIRFLFPEDDPRGIVLCALYAVKNKIYTDVDECAIKYYGKRSAIPKEYMIYFTGQDWDSQLHFLKPGESWAKPGVRYAMKVVAAKRYKKF